MLPPARSYSTTHLFFVQTSSHSTDGPPNTWIHSNSSGDHSILEFFNGKVVTACDRTGNLDFVEKDE